MSAKQISYRARADNPVSVSSPFLGAHLRWPFERHQRPFVVRVVEPARYMPATHGDIFNAALTALLTRPRRTVDSYSAAAALIDARQFDLITFPEAFIDSETLLAALAAFAPCGPSGCVHTGLRPAAAIADRHLFTVEELVALRDALLALLPDAEEDLVQFDGWLAGQNINHRFNLGCMFLNDATGRTRVCLHPKLVRSKYEIGPQREALMKEANLLSVITLLPTRKELGTVTLQPLICSDALNLPTDAALEPPMEAVNKYAACLGDTPPDHIDLVSVAACTPQVVRRLGPGREARSWHERYSESFIAAARAPGCARHHFAAVVLANFQEIDTQPAGLSGVFLPVAARTNNLGAQTCTSLWGAPGKDDPSNRWSRADDDLTDWRSRGYVTSLEPGTGGANRIFGFTIHRLVRETSPWDPATCLVDLGVNESVTDADGNLIFPIGDIGHA